ncbi:hypothetical protein vseg_009456 [Gypsophila vaccaria]
MRTKRKNLIEERYNGTKRRQMMFLRMVEERMSKMKTSLAPFLSNDLMFKIFLLLPVKTLLRFTCVCKSWKKMINCAEFVEAYNNEAQTTALILRKIKPERVNTFHVETQVNQLESFSIFPCTPSEMMKSNVINFLDIEGGKSRVIDLNISCSGSIVATCNGLILISSMFERVNGYWRPKLLDSHKKPGRLIIMNPMTRKFIKFPLGTLPSDVRYSESYGLMYSHSKGVYKVVHMFMDESGHIACELWSLETRQWKSIDGPSKIVIRRFSQGLPIWASGALHWLFTRYNNHPQQQHHTDFLLSFDAEDERFFVIDLPKSFGFRDKVVEMGGFLTFVSSLDVKRVEVWVLKGLGGAEWVIQHTIHIDAVVGYVENETYCTPVIAVNAKEMIFRRGKQLYLYDFEVEEAREIETVGECMTALEFFLPHSNNLATWERLQPML